MIPAIVHHPVPHTLCTFLHLIFTTNQIRSYYPSTVARSESWRSQVSYLGTEFSMPVSASLEFALKSPWCQSSSSQWLPHSLPKKHLLPVATELEQSWGSSQHLSSSNWLIPDWPRTYRKQMEQTRGSCWAQKRQSSPAHLVFFTWHFARMEWY